MSIRFLYKLALFLCSAAFMQAQEGTQQVANLGRCRLESGRVIEQCQVGYRTYGKLSASMDNAVLMPTYLYGRSGELAALFSDNPSSNRLVDTTRFFGVALDALGNGISSSPSNSKTQHGADFPGFTMQDIVETQYRLVTEILHLKHAHAVIGLSMGGEQTFAWAVSHPEFVDLAVPIIGTPRLTPFDLQTKQIMLDAIAEDPDYHGGRYTTQPGLKLANLYNVQAVTSPEFRNTHTTRDTFADFVYNSEVPLQADANDRVWQLRAVVSHDVIGKKTIAEVAQATPVHFFVVVSAKDHMVAPQPALEWAAAAKAPTYVSQGDCAHMIMSCDAPAVSKKVQQFLAGELNP